MKILNRWSLFVAAAALFYCLPSVAQNAGTVTNHAVAIGKGPGVTGLGSAGPGTNSQALMGNTGADPNFRTITGSDVQNTQTGTGAVARTVQNKFTDAYSAADFGVKCDGVTNASTAIGVADAAAAAAGKALRFPGGTCIVGSAITPSTGAHWIGDSYQNTTLKANSAACNVLAVSNSFVTLDELSFASTVTCTSGAFIAVSAGNFTGHDLYASGAFNCLTIGTSGASVSVAVVLLDKLQCLNTVATGVSVVVNNTGGGNVEFRNFFADNSPAARTFAHINLINSPDFTCVDCNLLSAQNNWYINPGTGQTVVSLHVIGGFSDQASANAMIATLTGTGFFGRSSFVNHWFYCANSSCNGAELVTAGTSNIDGIEFTDCEAYSNSSTSTNGFTLSQGASTTIKNIAISGGRVAAWTNGVNIGGATSVYINGLRSGPAGGFGANTNGIALGGTIGTAQIVGSDISGNTTALSNSATISTLMIRSSLPSSVNTAISVSEGGTGDAGTAWTAYTPTLSCAGAGSAPTTSAIAGRSKTVGKTTNIEIAVTLSSTGSCAAGIAISLPNTSNSAAILTGRENATTGAMLQGYIASAASSAVVTKYDNTVAQTNGYQLIVSGGYENQ
jgi:hypothetical protein